MTRTAKQLLQSVIRGQRLKDRLEDAGIVFKHERRLMRMTNIQTCWGGHLKDATCHYRTATEVSGNTFPIKDVLKSNGFKWDHEHKVWYHPNFTKWDEVRSELCRELAA